MHTTFCNLSIWQKTNLMLANDCDSILLRTYVRNIKCVVLLTDLVFVRAIMNAWKWDASCYSQLNNKLYNIFCARFVLQMRMMIDCQEKNLGIHLKIFMVAHSLLKEDTKIIYKTCLIHSINCTKLLKHIPPTDTRVTRKQNLMRRRWKKWF